MEFSVIMKGRTYGALIEVLDEATKGELLWSF
jgi:hypothetical protein